MTAEMRLMMGDEDRLGDPRITKLKGTKEKN
jgi:hypothetical protein